MDRLFFFILVFVFHQISNAATHCVCEIGQQSNEKFFYRLGCDVWLKSKKCHSRRILDRRPTSSLAKAIPILKSGDTLLVGYVGHWIDTEQTIDYVDSQLVPIAQQRNISVRYDNTACNPMKEPEAVQEYLLTLDIPASSRLDVEGNQNISLGMWDEVHIGKTSFYAYASTEWSGAKFPPCESMQGKVCSRQHQAGERGRCYNRQIKRLIWLTCQDPQNGKHAFEWTRN